MFYSPALFCFRSKPLYLLKQIWITDIFWVFHSYFVSKMSTPCVASHSLGFSFIHSWVSRITCIFLVFIYSSNRAVVLLWFFCFLPHDSLLRIQGPQKSLYYILLWCFFRSLVADFFEPSNLKLFVHRWDSWVCPLVRHILLRFIIQDFRDVSLVMRCRGMLVISWRCFQVSVLHHSAPGQNLHSWIIFFDRFVWSMVMLRHAHGPLLNGFEDWFWSL